jgi:hypothetical protein
LRWTRRCGKLLPGSVRDAGRRPRSSPEPEWRSNRLPISSGRRVPGQLCPLSAGPDRQHPGRTPSAIGASAPTSSARAGRTQRPGSHLRHGRADTDARDRRLPQADSGHRERYRRHGRETTARSQRRLQPAVPVLRQQPAQPLPQCRSCGSSPRSRCRRAFRRRSPRVIPFPLPLPTERPPRCVWDTKPVLPHQEDVPVSTTSLPDNRP